MFRTFDISLLMMGMPIDRETLSSRSLGGSESAGLQMAGALARAGAHVTVFCNTPGMWTDDDGVNYSPATEWPAFAKNTPHDVCIVQRAPEAFAQRTNARLNVLWCHDLATGRQAQAFKGGLWNIDCVIVLSRFMRDQYREVYQLGAETLFVSRNGVDPELFRAARRKEIKRDRKKLIYCARPERGLDVLLRHIMPELFASDSDLRLYIAGYDNRPDEWKDFYADCVGRATEFGNRVLDLGCLAKSDLYAQYLSAGVYVYPTPSPALPAFREVSCITAMECQAAGLPIVTTANGALPETIAAGAGTLIDLDPSVASSLPDYVQRFTNAVLGFVHDVSAWTAASERGLQISGQLDWSLVATEWLTEFERLIRARSNSTERLARHFWRTSDIVPLKALLARRAVDEQLSSDHGAALAGLAAPWSFMDEPDGYRRQYERIGAVHDPGVYQTAPFEPRFALLQEWLEERTHDIRTVLDYGCAHGAYLIGLAERIGHLQGHGVDIDRFSINMATKRAKELELSDRVRFAVWTHDAGRADIPVPGARPASFDCALLQEVLEHVPEPWSVLELVEREVRVGGAIYLTVPFGPWEFTSYRTFPHRCHVWHFDTHDLRDMLGSKSDLLIQSLYAGDNPLTGEPQGWWIVSYIADHNPIPPIHLERHLWLQKPRQSLCVAIIGGPGAEETLHWTLRSVQDVADDVVLADCGLNDEARRIASHYNVRLIPGLNPMREGFEQARNATLDASGCDWCLWIDTDERLVGADNLEKYLRENAYHAYCIRQHNFTCDTPSSFDLPVRLFRRRPYDGRLIRFWGAIHEHPELALNAGTGPTIALRDVNVAHIGYLSEDVRRARLERNSPLLDLDRRRYPDRLLQKHFIMRDNMHAVRNALRRNGGHVDDRMREKCRETVRMYQKHFLGQTHQARLDSIEYYSEALVVLGEGFEALFQLDVDQAEAKSNGAKRYRFASSEDLYAELKRVATDKAKPYDSPWW